MDLFADATLQPPTSEQSRLVCISQDLDDSWVVLNIRGPFGKAGYISVYVGVCTVGLIKGDTRGLEYSSYGLFSIF